MSIDLANIRMLRVLGKEFRAKSAASHQFRMNGDLMGRMAAAFFEAADELERNPIGQAADPGQFGKVEP